MPGLDGFEFTRHIRATPLLSHLPVIMITSADDRREAAEAAGVTVLLGKPTRKRRCWPTSRPSAARCSCPSEGSIRALRHHHSRSSPSPTRCSVPVRRGPGAAPARAARCRGPDRGCLHALSGAGAALEEPGAHAFGDARPLVFDLEHDGWRLLHVQHPQPHRACWRLSTLSALPSRLRTARRIRLMSISAVRVLLWRSMRTRARASRGRSARQTAIRVSMSVSCAATDAAPASDGRCRQGVVHAAQHLADDGLGPGQAFAQHGAAWPSRAVLALCSAALALLSGRRTSWASTSSISERSCSRRRSSSAWCSISARRLRSRQFALAAQVVGHVHQGGQGAQRQVLGVVLGGGRHQHVAQLPISTAQLQGLLVAAAVLPQQATGARSARRRCRPA